MDPAAVPGPGPFDVAPARERVWDVAVAVACGGALGGAARYGLNTLFPHSPDQFPVSTFVENVVGCLLLGALMVFLLEVWPPRRYLRPFLGVGVLGGFTTFSAYTSEIRGLVQEGEVPVALLYLFGSVAAGLAAVWTGSTLARAVAGDKVKEDV
jgi:CrcB protein